MADINHAVADINRNVALLLQLAGVGPAGGGGGGVGNAADDV